MAANQMEAGLPLKLSPSHLSLKAKVDEYDVVKYNGERLFIAPRSMDCCFVFEDTVVIDDDGGEGLETGGDEDGASSEGASTDENPNEPPARGIRVLVTNADTASVSDEALIPVADDQSVEGLYITSSSLIALTSTAWWGRHGSNFSLPERWTGQSVGVDIYDLEDNYSKQAQFRIEGSLVNSRRTEAGVTLITRHTPDIEGFTFYPSTPRGRKQQCELAGRP